MAIAADGRFGRAYSGWALALFSLGRVEEAEALWERALNEMDTMSERERLRTLGLYYVAIAGDYPKAVESLESNAVNQYLHHNFRVFEPENVLHQNQMFIFQKVENVHFVQMTSFIPLYRKPLSLADLF